MMDPVTLVAGAVALVGAGAAWLMCCRARHVEAQAAQLRQQLHAVRHAASHDPLTGLPNRRAFNQLGATMLADPTRHPLVAVVIDIDNFKEINDRLGHAVGDQVLVTIAHRFASYAGNNLVARLGGDEFVGLFTASNLDRRWLGHATRRLSRSLAAPIHLPGHRVTVTASVGMIPVPPAARLTEVLHYADAAMYRAKPNGPHLGNIPATPTGERQLTTTTPNAHNGGR